jgi:hypothetical protein
MDAMDGGKKRQRKSRPFHSNAASPKEGFFHLRQ